MGDTPRHVPVLHTAVLQILAPARGETVLDCTLGLGGHSASFLERTAPDGRLTALDADETNIAHARERLKPFGDRVRIVHANFRDVATLDLGTFDIVFGDLGLSSPHVDDPERGFSFRFAAPLDLRYDRTVGPTAADFLAQSDEEELVTVFHEYGDFHQRVRPLAKLLAGKRIATTTELKSAVEEIFTYRAPSVLPQVFQALRIAVNDELGALRSLLTALPALLSPGGRAGFLSYHSLEDRLVKHTFKALCEPEKDPLTGRTVQEAAFSLLTKKAIVPDDAERTANPRSRSAKLRVLQKAS